MNYSFHPEAETEFFNAINYYEDCEIGLDMISPSKFMRL